MKIDYVKKLKIPDKPGVYLFRRGKSILYIGKATMLRSRIRSYFGKGLEAARGPLVSAMVLRADNLKWQETGSVLEALMLEANLIKKYQPRYNAREKDDKSFNHVVITREELPKVIIVRGKNLKDFSGSFFGPFTNGGQLREAMKLIRKIFPYLAEKSKNYHEFYRQLNLAPDLENRKMYLRNIRNIRLFFQGKKKKILHNLKKEMKAYAKRQEFEKAGEVKRQIFALEHINDVSLLKLEPSTYPSAGRAGNLEPSFRIEAYDVAHLSGKSMVGVMTVVEDGLAAKNEYRKFKIRTQGMSNDTGALVEVIERRLGHQEWRYPNLIVLDGGKAQLNTARRVQGKFGVRIPVVSVVKDERHRAREILGRDELARKY